MTDPSYIRGLYSTAAALTLQAAEAHRRQLYGLEQAFTDAAASAASWAKSLADDAALAVIEADIARRSQG